MPVFHVCFSVECLWKAPEILRSGGTTWTPLTDVYSFGIILQEVLTREAPFYKELLTMSTGGMKAHVLSQ